MIRGLDHFRRYFRDYAEEFILVGGVATYLLLDEIGAERVRATKDLDLVLMMNPTPAFVAAFATQLN